MSASFKPTQHQEFLAQIAEAEATGKRSPLTLRPGSMAAVIVAAAGGDPTDLAEVRRTRVAHDASVEHHGYLPLRKGV